ncbi:hypothetical protein [uncultured Draconibacterium sp.]|uniref:hypothetical protein n=1 Tax=uncultured Draconibacterium sp. TaxID=1573823 RepID=UPI002AA89142|nr:hypothetical protein [uncultured Draconibacterium sp.]
MKKLTQILIVLFLGLSSCEEQEPGFDIESTIAGTISGSEIFSNIEVDSIMVLLIDADFEPDTIEYNNKAAFVDTVYTDINGSFIFTNVAEGNYYVYPMKSGYQFTGKNISPNNVLEISDEDYIELEFTAGALTSAGLNELFVDYVNCPDNASGKLNWYRQEWIYFIPLWTRINTNIVTLQPEDAGRFTKSIWIDSGYTYLVYTLTNTFKVECTLIESDNETTKTFEGGIGMFETFVNRKLHYQFNWETEEKIEIE